MREQTRNSNNPATRKPPRWSRAGNVRNFTSYRRAIAVTLFAVLAASGGFTSFAAESVKPTLRKKELKTLIRTASTAFDHQKLAAYYRQKAAHLANESKDHGELAEAYSNRTVYEPKTSVSGGLLHHCREFAAELGKAATEVEALASIHEEMARQASK